jgi:peptidoglycan/xylan/chitin deacetylase (PgdA/CDA1 family)
LEEEIIGDRKQLQDWTGKDIRWFAYPFGGIHNVSPEAKEYLKNASFSAAFTLVPQFFATAEDRLMVGRDSLDMMESDRLWIAWLDGAYDGTYRLKARLGLMGRISY